MTNNKIHAMISYNYEDNMKIDLTRLQEEIDGGFVNVQKHPNFPLFIYKYSIANVYTKRWNDITNIARGLVLDELGNIVVNCMPKFHNNVDEFGSATFEKNKDKKYSITEKWDGSLIQVAKWNGNYIITSSGSFQSPQALKATELFNKNGLGFVEENKTYIFEIIYKTNKIVIDYGDLEILTLLAIRNTETGEEISFSPNEFLSYNFKGVSPIDKTFDDVLKEQNQEKFTNREGYVIKFENGDRVKVKFSQYVILHKLVSGINENYLWENLQAGNDWKSIMQNVPDEMFSWAETTVNKILDDYNVIDKEVKSLYDTLSILNLSRKDQANWLLSKHREYSSMVFAMLDKKDYSEKIWKMIKPVANTKSKFGMGENI